MIHKRILVTGAGGFIGSGLCISLLSEGRQVFAAIRNRHAPIGAVTVKTAEISPETDWSDALDKIDVVVHLANIAHNFSPNYDEVKKTNVLGTIRLAEQAADMGVKRFIYISSVKVYGNKGALPYKESDTPSPADDYGKSKWEAEQNVISICRQTGLESVIIRPPLVYGPGVSANFFKLMQFVDKGLWLPFGSVDNIRSFIYSDNLASAIIKCIDSPKAAGKFFSVSDNQDISTKKLISLLSKSLKRPVKLFKFPQKILKNTLSMAGKSSMADSLLESFSVDIASICKETGWTPPHKIEQGIDKTVSWYIKTFRQK